jgi:hypothetical protein
MFCLALNASQAGVYFVKSNDVNAVIVLAACLDQLGAKIDKLHYAAGDSKCC